ncbi:hypothetical protein SAMN04490182_2836 [Pseudomonas cedrina]|uniref:Uncharacterized protein n=2 Tax=Pseudomonas cedrina TaxID=651740 RepID=A0A1V2KG59_PSECE|nr:hypothetical protein [Pseudomonas cedrina]ONH55831.1 hypothetical protein BLL36_06870 [Pseudomonas cedrina subsp. cedrina]SDS94639.1 hypothetical protein SAMN04490182_2836 [Pseudomonas cedrina]
MRNRLVTFLTKNKWEVSVVLLLIFVICVVLFYVDTFGVKRSYDQAAWGQFGDYMGGVLNPTLSFCAFVGLMLTLKFQYSESKKTEERQVGQQFDSRLFQMFGLLSTALSTVHLSIVKNIVEETYTGPKAFAVGRRELVSVIESVGPDLSDEETYGLAVDAFGRWSTECGDALLSYFDTLLFVVLYIRNNSSGERRVFAARALRSQLSQDTRVILFYTLLLSGNITLYRFLEGFGYWGSEISENTAPRGRGLLRALVLSKDKSTAQST